MATYPDPAREALHAALAFETLSASRLGQRQEAIQLKTQTINSLLDLNTALAAEETAEEIQKILGALKERGIDLPYNVSKEELKSLANSHIDRIRTDTQIGFSDIQTILENLKAVLDAAKLAVKTRERELETYTRNQRAGA